MCFFYIVKNPIFFCFLGSQTLKDIICGDRPQIIKLISLPHYFGGPLGLAVMNDFHDVFFVFLRVFGS